jgi:hypothetical protein
MAELDTGRLTHWLQRDVLDEGSDTRIVSMV